jgi:release factor glutamine methyltransferase
VRDHEPEIALYGGGDGLRVVARLLAETGPLLKPAGHLTLEIAQGQAPAVRGLAQRSAGGWRVIRTIADHAGIERVLMVQKEKRS